MRRWTKQIRALELFGKKNRLGRGSNLGQAGGNLCLWGPERFFSIVRNAQYKYPLFERAKYPRFSNQKRGYPRAKIRISENFLTALFTSS